MPVARTANGLGPKAKQSKERLIPPLSDDGVNEREAGAPGHRQKHRHRQTEAAKGQEWASTAQDTGIATAVGTGARTNSACCKIAGVHPHP